MPVVETSSVQIFEVVTEEDGVFGGGLEFLEKNGFVILKVLGADECERGVYDQIDNIIMSQPYKEQNKILLTREQVLETLMRPLSRGELKYFVERWTFHRGFGAACDPTCFHTPFMWEVRQNPNLYKMAARALGTERVAVDINRSFQKLPGQGSHAFLHWDINPFNVGEHHGSLQGKVCYTPSRFVCVPGTHEESFWNLFKSKYKDLVGIKKQMKGEAKLGLRMEEDPLSLFKMQREFPIPAGCMVVWKNTLLHGHVPTPKNEPTEFGMYLGFLDMDKMIQKNEVYRKESQKLLGSKNMMTEEELVMRGLTQYKMTGIGMMEDRVRSFNEGVAPILWPSFDTIFYYPKRFYNFSSILKKHIDKWEEGTEGVTTRTTQKGDVVPHVIPVRRVPYDRPVLTMLGKFLLGVEAYPSGGSTLVTKVSAPALEATDSAAVETVVVGVAVGLIDNVEGQVDMVDQKEEDGGHYRGVYMEKNYDTESDNKDEQEGTGRPRKKVQKIFDVF